jgi:hypothetical protein
VPANGDLSEAKRNLIQQYLSGRISQKLRLTRPITRRRADTPVLASLSQEQLLLRENGRRDMPALYNECFTVRMVGPVDVPRLEQSLAEIIRRHEIWRTSYDIVNGSFVQVVHPPSQDILPVIDLRGLGEERVEEEALRVATEQAQLPFDLSRGPLMRLSLMRTATAEYRLSIAAHLSIIDGMSVYQLFPSELARLYAAFCAGEPSPLSELPIQYGDYAFWQRSWLVDDEVTRQLAYWRKQFAGGLPLLQWPTDRARPTVFTHRGEIQSFRLSPPLSDAIKNLTRREGVTLFAVLLASFACLLYCYTSQVDLVIGTPSPAGRKRSEVQSLLGYFLNPVALRISLQDDPPFSESVRRAQNVTAQAIAYDDLPIEVLAKELHLNIDASRSSLFTVAISLQPESAGAPGWRVTSMDASSGGAVWDLYVAFINGTDGIVGRAQYNRDLFEAQTITHAMQDLQIVIERMVADSGQPVSTLCQHVRIASDRQMKEYSGGKDSV